jgi:hypothetical protein
VSEILWRWAFGEDLVGGLGPGKGFAAVVVGVDEDADRADEVGDAGERAASDGLTGDDPEKDLDEVHPGRAGRGEVQRDPGVLGQPGFHGRVAVDANQVGSLRVRALADVVSAHCLDDVSRDLVGG